MRVVQGRVHCTAAGCNCKLSSSIPPSTVCPRCVKHFLSNCTLSVQLSQRCTFCRHVLLVLHPLVAPSACYNSCLPFEQLLALHICLCTTYTRRSSGQQPVGLFVVSWCRVTLGHGASLCN